jgi:hypothetical protein
MLTWQLNELYTLLFSPSLQKFSEYGRDDYRPQIGQGGSRVAACFRYDAGLCPKRFFQGFSL